MTALGSDKLSEIKAAAETLPLSQQEDLLVWLQTKLAKPLGTTGERVAGLHGGAWTVADDFDCPLPDDFWLGSGDPIVARYGVQMLW